MRRLSRLRSIFSQQAKVRRSASKAAPVFIAANSSQPRRLLIPATPLIVAEPLEARRLLSTTVPTLLAISPATPAGQATGSATYVVTFNEPVTGVTAADFAVAAGTGVAVSPTLVVSPSSGYQSVYAVSEGGISGNGSLGLNLVNSAGIVDAAGTAMAGTSSNAIFPSPVNYAAGWDPESVTVGDFTGDDKADLAVANEGDRTVSVLLGNGNGTFQAAVNYAAGWDPLSVTVGDFTGDGKADLAVADGGGGVSVLLGNGNGTFQAAVNYAAGSAPDSVTVGDFTGDGKADLAVADQEGGVSVLLGNGNGTFQAAVNYAAGWRPESVTVGDFTGDGKADLAVANYGSNNVSVLLGNGNGTFQAAVNYAAGSLPESVTVGDFTGDGKADLAVADYYGGVSVLLGNGNGTFQAAVNYAAGTYPDSVTVGDFTGDGKADLAVADWGGGVSVLLNTSAGATPSWLGAGSAASWNASTQTLTVTGNATITANPATFSNTPIIDANTGSHLVLNTPSATIGGLALQTGATLDIGNNTLFINYGNGSTPLAAVQAGVGNGSIISSTANAGPTGQYTVGYADSTEMSAVPSGNVELVYTLSGDSRLTETVNFLDYSILQNNYNQTGRDWAQGDWDNNGTVNFLDYSMLQNNYNQSVPAALAGAATATPLPQTSYTAATALPLSPDNQNQLDTDAAIDGWSQQGVIGYVL